MPRICKAYKSQVPFNEDNCCFVDFIFKRGRLEFAAGVRTFMAGNWVVKRVASCAVRNNWNIQTSNFEIGIEF